MSQVPYWGQSGYLIDACSMGPSWRKLVSGSCSLPCPLPVCLLLYFLPAVKWLFSSVSHINTSEAVSQDKQPLWELVSLPYLVTAKMNRTNMSLPTEYRPVPSAYPESGYRAKPDLESRVSSVFSVHKDADSFIMNLSILQHNKNYFVLSAI